MLSAPAKNRRRRRRRRKHVLQSTEKTVSSQVDGDEATDEPFDDVKDKHSYSPKVNVKFIDDEVEIETAMLIKRFDKNADVQAKQKERGVKFFTSVVRPHELAASEKDDEIQAIDEIQQSGDDVMPTPSSAPMNYPEEEGPQLASSYLNENFENASVPFEKKTCVFDLNQLYLPSLVLTKQLADDIESAANTETTDEDKIDARKGFYVKKKPQILQINRTQFINRLIVEGAFQWLDAHDREIRHLMEIVISNRLIKTFCAEKFHRFEYPETSVDSMFDAYALQDRILKIHIKTIRFDRHPLFNVEHRLVKDLEMLYNEYSWRKQNAICENMKKRLNVLRQLLNTTSNSLRKRKKAQTSVVENFRIYIDELKTLRASLHRERAKDRELIESIMKKWSELRKEYEKQNNRTPPLKLLIKVQQANAERDEEEWNFQFNLELNEMIQEATDLYREQKQQWKSDAKRASDSDAQAIPKPSKPDTAAIERELFETFTNSMRPPGEEIIDFELEKGATAIDKNLPKYMVRLVLDNDQLDFPESTRLNLIGEVSINAVFSIKFTTRIPAALKFQIFEKHLPIVKRVAEIRISVPHDNEVFEVTPTLFSEFIENQPSTTKGYSGKIASNIGWSILSTDNDQWKPFSVQSSVKVGTPTRKTIEANDQLANDLIDPMDPENCEFVQIIDNTRTSASIGSKIVTKRKDVFRLNEDAYAFCPRDKLNDNKRIEILNARFNSDLKLKDCKLIPHNEIEIEFPTNLKIFEDMLWVDPIDVQRYQGKKYLKYVYDIITNHCEVINRNYEHRDLLIGDTPPTLYGAIEALTNMFSPRRPLNPNRHKTTSAVRKSNYHEDNIHRFNIIVNVVRASGIPYRNNSNEMPTSSRRTSFGSTMQNLHRNANVRPFVTATFRDKTLRTSTVNGTSPTWNEQIVIPINDGINQIKDSIWFHMYDEVIEDLPSSDNLLLPNTEIYQKISSHYLGELLIPFSTIYASQRIEGTFEMSTPQILLGYTKPSVNVPYEYEYTSDAGGGGSIESRQSILVSLLISIEPIIEVTNFLTSHLECVELNIIKNRINVWLTDLIEEFPHRAQDPLVCLANGKRVCITRLVGPIDIPFERNETSEYMIRRFVSLIPVRPHKNVCTKLNGVWLTNDQILNILLASPKDLGVLLTGYYLSLGYNAFLIMGFAIPYGDTTFVLTKENNECFLIDPHTGRKCSSRDTFCALTKIYCVVNQTNIWANIQREHRVFMQNFDLTQSTEWRELFTKSIPAPSDSVHDLTLAYTDSLDCENLRQAIEMKLIKKFGAWRMDRKTAWNKRYRELLMNILQELEQDRCFGFEQKSYIDKLMEMTQSKCKLSGYPINMPYVSISRIVERIKATGIHLCTDPKVEFSIAVHIQSYPMNVLSVWVFPFSIIPTT